MKMLLHNLKVAGRNLMKYKLQTIISVASIAIGIVTLSFAISVMTQFRLPTLYDEPYYNRTYSVRFVPLSGDDGWEAGIPPEIIPALKGPNAPKSIERVAVPNGMRSAIQAEFHLSDSSIRKGVIPGAVIDPETANLPGLRSAITGKKIKMLKAGEAIINEKLAKRVFKDADPIGAVQTHLDGTQIIPVTIVDVIENPSRNDGVYGVDGFFFSNADHIEQQDFREMYASIIYVVLKEGSNEQQLRRELNDLVKPMELEAKLSREMDNPNIKTSIKIRLITYLIGSLILLASIISYLRIQMQLFTLRRRELSLRIVNGASRLRLFGLLLTELLIPVLLAVALSLLLGTMLEEFMDKRISMLSQTVLYISSLWRYSLLTGAILVLLCSLMAWWSLARIYKERRGLASVIRRQKNHIFRNVMLTVQIAICMILLCGTFILVAAGSKVLDTLNIPDDDSRYKEYLLLRPGYADEPERLIEEISRLRDLREINICHVNFFGIEDIAKDPEIMEKFNNFAMARFYSLSDTTLLNTLGIEVKWIRKDADRNNCIILHKELYDKLIDVGLINDGTLTIRTFNMGDLTLPVAGITMAVPYDRGLTSVIIHPDWNKKFVDYLLIPKDGKGKELARSVAETINRLEPSIINDMVFNFRDLANLTPSMIEVIRTGGWILGIVSVIITAMSIFSTISLDTRARKKEVAIRKVNGAKNADIYRIFARVYVLLIVVALAVAVPVLIMFCRFADQMVGDWMSDGSVSPAVPIILGVAVIILIILLIVFRQIHRILQTDPAKIIAKE